MRIWLWLIVAALAGLGAGLARAWVECGGFDPSRALAGLDFPPPAGPDYWQPPAGRSAKAAFAETEFQFGSLAVGRTMKRDFAVRNAGDWPLVLRVLESSCVCTLARLPERPLQPGESGTVTLEWSAPDGAMPGERYRQWASVATNDPQQGTVTLVVEGSLTAPLAADVAELSLGRVAASQTKAASFRLQGFQPPSGRLAPPAVTHEWEIAETTPYFTATPHSLPADELRASGAAYGWRIDVTVKPGLPPGPFLQTIRLRTNLPDVPGVAVPIRGEIGPDVFVAGPGYSERTGVLVLPTQRDGATVSRQVNLVAFSPAADPPATEDIGPRIASVTPGALRATLGDAQRGADGGMRWPLTVEIAADAEPQVSRGPAAENLGKLVIETDRAGQSRLEIGVSFAVEKRK